MVMVTLYTAFAFTPHRPSLFSLLDASKKNHTSTSFCKRCVLWVAAPTLQIETYRHSQFHEKINPGNIAGRVELLFITAIHNAAPSVKCRPCVVSPQLQLSPELRSSHNELSFETARKVKFIEIYLSRYLHCGKYNSHVS